MDEKCVDFQGSAMSFADGAFEDFLKSMLCFTDPWVGRSLMLRVQLGFNIKSQSLLRDSTMSKIRIHKVSKTFEHPQGTVIFEVKQQRRKEKVCAQNAKPTQKYNGDIWINSPNDKSTLKLQKGTFNEDGGQQFKKLFGLKCIKRSNLQQSSQDIIFPSNWKHKELIEIAGDTQHRTKHFFLAN